MIASLNKYVPKLLPGYNTAHDLFWRYYLGEDKQNHLERGIVDGK